MSEEALIAIDIPVEGFFNGVYVVADAMAFTTTAAQGIPTKAPIPPSESNPTEEGTPTKGVVIGESVLIFADTSTP